MSKVSKKKQNIISILIIIIGIFLAFRFLGSRNSQENQEETNTSVVNKKVGIMVVGEDGSKSAQIFKTAIFSAIQSADVVAEQGGRITWVNFEVGDKVKKGQILASFDQSGSKNSAKVALDDSLSTLALAEDNLKKTRKSVGESLEIAKNNKHIEEIELEQAIDDGDQDEIDLAEQALENAEDAEDKAEEDAEITINNAKLQVAQSQASVNQNRIAYEHSLVRAPVSGTIVLKNVNVYDYLNSGSKVAEISGVGTLRSKVYLSGFEIQRVRQDDEVAIWFDEKFYKGKVISLSGLANSANNRYEVQIESIDDISNKTNRPAKIEINLFLKQGENSFFVPLSAINIGQQDRTVFLFEDGKAVLKEIEINETVGDQVQVISGLKEGDRVIIDNNRSLRDGEEVELK